MTVSLKHAFTSIIGDSGDTSLVQPSNWNAEHTLTLAQGNILGRLAAAGTGAATEIPLSFDASNNVTFPGQVNLVAGTTSIAPLDFTSGSLLTSPVAGAVEYDGKVIYGTPQGTQRGVIPGIQFFRLNSNLAGANSSSAQSTFGVGVTLSSSTVYKFQADFQLYKTAGTTSHTVSMLFAGTATLNSIYYTVAIATGTTTQSNFVDTAVAEAVVNQATATVINTASSTATLSRYYTMSGIVSVNAGGTFIPQYQMSAAPGGAYSTMANSSILIYPIGASGANTSVGTWA